jgi:hypothetical protein
VDDLLGVPDPQPGELREIGSLSSDGGEVTGGRVTVTAATGVVSPGDTLAVALGRAGTTTSLEAFGQPVEGRHGRPLTGPVTIRWSDTRLDEHQRSTVLAAKWQADLATWEVDPKVPVVVEGDDLVLKVPDFSIWSWVAGLGQTLGEVTGSRVDAPKCGGALPSWVQQVVDPDEELTAAAIRVCFEPEGDRLTVKVANNRTFTQQMVILDQAASWAEVRDSGRSYGLQQAVIDAARMVLDGPSSHLIPPVHTVELVLERPAADAPGLIAAEAAVNGVTVMIDVATWLLDQQSIGGLENPYLNAFVQALFECGGRQVAAAGGPPNAVLPAVIDALGGCATEIMRPDSEFGQRMEQIARAAVQGSSTGRAARAYRLIGEAAQAFKVLSAGKVAFYLSDQLANAAVDPLSWSVRARPTPQELGGWTPTCRELNVDSSGLYRNVALQDDFLDTSRELHEFPGWAAAAAAGVKPLGACSVVYRERLADFLAGSWQDRAAAEVVASAIRRGMPGREPPGGSVPQLDALTLTAAGLGPLRLGASVAEAEATGMVWWNPASCPAEVHGRDIGGLQVHPRYTILSGPNPVGLAGFPAFGVDVDSASGKLIWIEVHDPAITTEKGIGVGDLAADLEEAYGSELQYGDSSSPGQESFVRWMRRGDADIVFDIYSGPEGLDVVPPARIWSVGVMVAQERHDSRYRTDVGPGAC